MRRLLFVAAILLASLPAFAITSLSGKCQQGAIKVVTQGLNSASPFEASFPQCIVTVYTHGTTNPPPNLYKDNNLPTHTPLSDPFTANVDDTFQFYAPNGRYDVILTVNSLVIATLNDVLLCDPTDATAGAFSCTAGGGASGLCSTLIAGSLDVNPQTCAGAKTLQGLAPFVSSTVFQVLNPASNVQQAATTYFGDAISGFDNSASDDFYYTAQSYLTDVGQSAIGLLNPLDRLNTGSVAGRSQGLVVYAQQVANSTAGTTLASGITGIFDLQNQTSNIASTVYSGVQGVGAYRGNANIGLLAGLIGHASVRAPVSGSTGTIPELYGVYAFITNTGTASAVTRAAGLAIEGMVGANAAENYAWIYKGSTLSPAPASFLDSHDNLSINGALAPGGGDDVGGGKFTRGTIDSVGDVLCFTSSNTIGDCPTSATNPIGIGGKLNWTPGVIFSSGSGSQVDIFHPVIGGLVSVLFDGTYSPSHGWYACTSATTAGKVTPQVGPCGSGRQVGIISADSTSSTRASVWLQIAGGGGSALPTIFYQTVENASGATVTQRPIIEFTGSGVSSVLDDGANGRTVVTITASAGSGVTLQTNTVNNASQTALNLLNSAATNGITLTVTNTGGGNVQLGYTGTLTNAGLANSSITVNGQSCVLGSNCTIPFQTNGVGNTSTAGLNFITSTTNTVGLTITPSNPGTNQEKFEITGGSYTGNAATATNISTNGTANQVWGMNGAGTVQGWQTFSGLTNPMTTLGDIIYENASPAPARLAGPTSPNGIPQTLISVPSGGLATAPQWSIPGVPIDAQVGTTYNIPITDDVHLLTGNNAAATAWTGFTLANNYTFALMNLGAGLITYTPASGTVNGGATQIVPQNWFGFHYTDNTNTFMPIMPTFKAFPNTAANAALTFNSATGALGTLTSIVIGPGSSTNNDLACFNGTTGLLLSDCGIASGNVVTAASNAAAANQVWESGGANKTAVANDFPYTMFVPAANCNSATAGAGMSLPAASAPTVACRTGTNVNTGVLQFTAASQTAQFQVAIPLDANLSGTVYARAIYTQGNANTSQTLTLQIASGCGATDDATFNTLQSFSSSTTGATANTQYQATLSGLTMTGCTAGQTMNVKLNSSSVGTNQLWLQGVAITFPTRPVMQAN